MYQDEKFEIERPAKTVKASSKKKEAASKKEPVEIVSVQQAFPPVIPLLPITQATLFPGMVIPVILPEGKLTQTLEKAGQNQDLVGIVLIQEATQEKPVGTGPSTSVTGVPVEGTMGEGHQGKTTQLPFHRYGVLAKIIKKINLPDNQVSVLLSGLQRFQLKGLVSEEPLYIGKVEYISETMQRDTELEALLRSALVQFKALAKDNPLISEEVKVALVNIDGPGKLADFIASVFVRDVADYQAFLASGDVKDRLHRLLQILKKEREVQTVQKQISDEINQKVSTAQREFYLHEQLKAIQRELGKDGDKNSIENKFKDRLKNKNLKAEVKQRIDEEFEKLSTLHEASSEYSVAVNYLDWATSLPWGESTQDSVELSQALKTLNRDHYGLKSIKERILEYLAVRKLKGSLTEGSIICLVGPPGTGKTSLAKSIAEVMGRKFYRFSVGGMRDEAEIKGHRRTYVGAMPGKIIQGLKRAGSQNPVFLIDEIDKLGNHSHSGDPASALLEVLDPEQNKEFLDHYLDIPMDCSQVFFITTANTVDTIPSALLDRMEVISLSGYTDKEKFFIAKRHLIPKQREKNAIPEKLVQITDSAIYHIIHFYAREAGVRNLEKQFAKLFRKVAFRVASGNRRPLRIDSVSSIEKLLGPTLFDKEPNVLKGYGVATGLAWTALGGDVLYIESRSVPGKGGLVLTGSLGEVMQESASIAMTYIRQKAASLKIDPEYFEKNQIHIHVPQGATPKDGPSAGVTLVCSLYSLLTKKPFPGTLAMTGELSLTGKVLPVGGIKEKLLAAKRNGIKTVLLPKENEKDLKELSQESEGDLLRGLKLKLIGTMDDCLKQVFK